MKNYTIISATPMTHYKNQKGFDVIISVKVKGSAPVETKIWMTEEEYNLRIFIQNHKIAGNLSKKEADQFFELIENFGQRKYEEGSYDEAMANSED